MHDLDLALDADDRQPEPQSRIFRWTAYVVTVVLACMILLPVAHTLLRRVGITRLETVSSVVPHLTLWTGFLGAVLASISGKNLALSTAHLLPRGGAQRFARLYTGALTSAVTALLAYGAVEMVQKSYAAGSRFAVGIPTWCSEAVMPVTLTAIALRSIIRAPGGWTGRAISVAVTAAAFAIGRIPPEHAHHVGWPAGIVLGLGLVLGMPVYAAMAGVAMLLDFAVPSLGVPIASVPDTAFQLSTNATLPAVPLLTVAGYVLAGGGASERLVALYRAFLGWLPGGMALMALSVCAMFTALTGASGVTILAAGGVIHASLREEKYPDGFSLGLVTAAGSLGLLFPPSAPVLLYAIKAEVDIRQLYLAGLVPGLIIILFVAVYSVFVGIRCGAPRHPFDLRAGARALWDAKWDLALVGSLIGLVAAGIMTILEAAAFGALFSVLIEVAIHRNLHATRELPQVMASAATLIGSVIVLMAFALALSEALTLMQLPDAILEWVQSHIQSPWVYLLVLNALLLVLGSVFEMYSAIVLLPPLIAPLAVAYNVDPVHSGVVFLANLELGFLLPPMGLNLFLSALRFGQPATRVYKSGLPFLILMSAGVLLITYFPSVTTGVLKLLGLG